MMKDLLKELTEYYRDRRAQIVLNVQTISLPTLLLIAGFIQGKPFILPLLLYAYVFYAIFSHSAYIALAWKTDREPATPGQPAKQKISVRFPRMRPFGFAGMLCSFTFVAIIYLVPFLRNPVDIFFYGTPTPLPSSTATVTVTTEPTSTNTLTFTPRPANTATLPPTATPKAQGVYYMIVLDASAEMVEIFDKQTKWDAAYNAVSAILEGLESEAHYGLVVIGGSRPDSNTDPCAEPSVTSIPFTDRGAVIGHVNGLQPNGGGSIYTAFNLAREELKKLPEYAVRSLIFITGSKDNCEGRNEWQDIERIFKMPGGLGVELYSEIIVIEGDRLISKKIEDQFASLPSNILQVQSPATLVELDQTNINVTNNITNYISITIPTSPAEESTQLPEVVPTLTRTSTNTPTRVSTATSTRAPTRTPSFTATQWILDTPTGTATATATLEPSATSPPTLGPHQWNILIQHPEVFSLGCPMINQARLYGQFYNNVAGITTTLLENQYAGKGVSLEFSNIRSEGANYAGWEVWLGPDDTRGMDLSSYNYLTFYIRGTAGAEKVNIYLMNPTVNGTYRRYWKPIQDASPITTSWQKIVIPLSHFTSSADPAQVVNLRDVQRIQIVFEWYANFESGRVFVDDLCVE